jgi:hypothetical protein
MVEIAVPHPDQPMAGIEDEAFLQREPAAAGRRRALPDQPQAAREKKEQRQHRNERTRAELLGAAERGVARRAYGEARRYAAAGAGS